MTGKLGWRVGMVVLSAVLLAGSLVPSVAGQEPAKTEEPKSGEPAAEEKKKEAGLPLKPERKIEFTTDEGTWISLDVSPDGATIVFELLGNFYILPIEGGEARPLTSGMAFESQPRFSPDGQWIAFISDREGSENVWIMKADGSEPRQLSKDEQAAFASPAWSPDGQYVIVSRRVPGINFELWMYHVQGGSGAQITKSKPRPEAEWFQLHNALGAVSSPDGRYLYYSRRVREWGERFPFWQIARRDMRTGDEDIIRQARGSAMRPVLSPDGTKLAYGTRQDGETGLRIHDLATGEERWLKYPVQRDDQESFWSSRDLLPGYTFLPDGSEIVASYGGRIWRVNVSTSQERQISFTAKISKDIGPLLYFPERIEEGLVRARIIQNPTASPDGKRLAFSALTHLYVMDIPGGKPTRVTSGNAREFEPAWSPDGQWLAYVTWATEGGHIWKVRADGSGAPQQLTRTAAFYSDLAWSPDGQRIVALRAPRQARVEQPDEWYRRVAGLDLVWLSAEGGEANLIVPARGVGRPHFTEEKDRVYVYSTEGLISLRFDGTDRRTHVKVVGKSPLPDPRPAREVRISPDGTKALALVYNQLYLLMVPRVGGEPPTVNMHTPSVPVKKLTDVGADYIGWADGGQTITWALGSSFFRQPLASVTFEPEKKEEVKEQAQEKEDEAKGQERKPEAKPLYEEIEVVIERPRHTPRGTIVLRGAKVITMRGDEVIENADVVVTDNRIAAVGRRGTVKLPTGARLFDVRGMTIVPGFIDTHAHWFEIRRGVLDMENWSFLANLAYGVTTGRDPQTATNDMFAYQDLVDMGEMIGLRAFSTGPGVFLATDFQSLDEARHTVARYKKYYRTNTLKSYIVGNRRQRQWMVEACKEYRIMPTTEGFSDLKLDLTHIIDGFAGNEHNFPITPLYKDVVELVAKSGLAYTPTLLVAYGGPSAENRFYTSTESKVHDDPKLRRFVPHSIIDGNSRRRMWFHPDEYHYPKVAEAAGKIVRSRGRVGIGSHGQLQGLGYHWELWAVASGRSSRRPRRP